MSRYPELHLGLRPYNCWGSYNPRIETSTFFGQGKQVAGFWVPHAPSSKTEDDILE